MERKAEQGFAATQQPLLRATMRALFLVADVISLDRYTALLAAPEVRQIFAASLIGRLPIGICGLAILLLVQTATASFAQGGAATACYVAGLAIVAPALGRLIDRYGPRTILLVCAVAFPAALAALVVAVTQEAAGAFVLASAACAGACFPPISVCMRTWFRQRFAESEQLRTAYSLESVIIELVFIVGPMLVAGFVAFASPAAAVACAAACGFAGTLLFLRSPALRVWRIEPRGAPSLLGPLTEPGFVPLVIVVLCFSCAFGLLEIGLTAYATERDNSALAGVLLGLMSVGSALGGIAYGSRSWRAPLPRQFVAMLAVKGLGLGVLSLGWGPWTFGVLCVLAGVVMAPVLIMQSMLVAGTARPEYATEAFTWSSSALLAGVGLGLAAGGGLLEVFRSGSALAAGAGSALLAAALAYATLARREAKRF